MNDEAAVTWLREGITDDKEWAADVGQLAQAARCDAALALLDVHAPVEDGTRLTCQVCVTWEDDEGEHEFGIALPVLWPCMTLEIAAAGYRHREGYARHWDAQACPGCGKPDVVLPLGHDLAVPMDGSAPSCSVAAPVSPAAGLRAGRAVPAEDGRCDGCRQPSGNLVLSERVYDGCGPFGNGRPVTVQFWFCPACTALDPQPVRR